MRIDRRSPEDDAAKLEVGLQERFCDSHDKRSGYSPVSSRAVASEFLEVAVCQLTSVNNVEANVAQILSCLRELEESPPDLVSFPENALYFRLKDGEAVPSIELDDSRLMPIRTWAKQFKSHIHLGSVPRRLTSGAADKPFNSTVLIDAEGEIADVYQKIHLFDVDVAGHKPVRESDGFAAGAKSSVFEIKGWKIGCTICYDLRFSELFLQYAKQGVEVILIPSAFLVPTGKAHWDILTRARAIESQTYILAAAQGGVHADDQGHSRSTYGHSIVVDPWGTVMGEVDDHAGARRVLRAKLSLEKLKSVRAQIPMGQHRRL